MPEWLTPGDLIQMSTLIVTLGLLHKSNTAKFAKMEVKVDLMWLHLKARLNIHEEDDNG